MTDSKSKFDQFKDAMSKRHGDPESTTNWGIVLGVVVYVAAVLVSAAYQLSLVDLILEPPYDLIGRLGAAVISLNALFLPLALKLWCFEEKHRAIAIRFYILDFVIIAANTLAAANGIRGTQIAILDIYMQWFAPASFVFTMAGWGWLFLTDPAQRVKFQQQQDQIGAQMIQQRAQNEFDLAEIYVDIAKKSAEADRMLNAVDLPPWMAQDGVQAAQAGLQQGKPTPTAAGVLASLKDKIGERSATNGADPKEPAS